MQEPDHMYDDIGSMDAEKKRLSKLCIRKMTNTFLILYRHLHCWTHHQSQANNNQQQIYDCGIKMHHILAASDDFTTLSMHWDLIPSARLNYQHDFRGLYNCVSQVTPFLPCLNLFFLFLNHDKNRLFTSTTPTTNEGGRNARECMRSPQGMTPLRVCR